MTYNQTNGFKDPTMPKASNPDKKNASVSFHPMQVVNDNQYKRTMQKGVDRTQHTLNNKKLGIRTDGTKIGQEKLNSKFNKN